MDFWVFLSLKTHRNVYYPGYSKLYISDDNAKEIRDQRKLLKEEYLKTLREREDVEFAYVAMSVPATIICSLKDQSIVQVIQK